MMILSLQAFGSGTPSTLPPSSRSIGGVLTHPLALVDIGLPDLTGLPGSTLAQGNFEVVDLKFDNHITFTGSQ